MPMEATPEAPVEEAPTAEEYAPEAEAEPEYAEVPEEYAPEEVSEEPTTEDIIDSATPEEFEETEETTPEEADIEATEEAEQAEDEIIADGVVELRPLRMLKSFVSKPKKKKVRKVRTLVRRQFRPLMGMGKHHHGGGRRGRMGPSYYDYPYPEPLYVETVEEVDDNSEFEGISKVSKTNWKKKPSRNIFK
jgi:hypothetical protein